MLFCQAQQPSGTLTNLAYCAWSGGEFSIADGLDGINHGEGRRSRFQMFLDCLDVIFRHHQKRRGNLSQPPGAALHLVDGLLRADVEDFCITRGDADTSLQQ